MAERDPGVSWRPHLNLANAATAAGFTAALVAILIVAGTGTPVPAGWRWTAAGLVIAAAGADLLDGTLARHYHTAGPFGHGLDTISDVVSFGVTPALIAYCSQLYRHPVPGAAAMVVWCVAVQWRLARYLVQGHQRSYTGCPCPVAAVILSVLVAAGAAAYPALAVMAVLSGLMVSSVPVPTWPQLLRVARTHRPALAPALPSCEVTPQAAPGAVPLQAARQPATGAVPLQAARQPATRATHLRTTHQTAARERA